MKKIILSVLLLTAPTLMAGFAELNKAHEAYDYAKLDLEQSSAYTPPEERKNIEENVQLKKFLFLNAIEEALILEYTEVIKNPETSELSTSYSGPEEYKSFVAYYLQHRPYGALFAQAIRDHQKLTCPARDLALHQEKLPQTSDSDLRRRALLNFSIETSQQLLAKRADEIEKTLANLQRFSNHFKNNDPLCQQGNKTHFQWMTKQLKKA